MGSKGGGQMQPMVMQVGQQSQTATTSADPYARGLYQDVLGRARGLTERPFEQYQAPRVAGFTPDQLAAFQGVRDIQGIAPALYGQAASAAQNILGALDPSRFAQNVQTYMSPYVQNVIGATLGNLGQQQARERADLTSRAIKAGAFGGDRAGMERAELARLQNLATAQTVSSLAERGYQGAVDQFNRAMQLGQAGATTLGGLASAGQQTMLQGLQGLLGTGAQQQALQQAQQDIAYQDFLQRQAYPYQQLSWLGGLAGSLGPALGGTTASSGTSFDTKYQAAPSLGSQIMGGLTTLGGLAAPTIANAIMPGLGSALGAGMGALGMFSPFPSRGYGAQYADGGAVDGAVGEQLLDRSVLEPDYTLNPYPEMRADGGRLGSAIQDPLIMEKMVGMLPYGGVTSSISPQLIAMNQPRGFSAPRVSAMKSADLGEGQSESQAQKTPMQGFLSGLKTALERKPAAFGGFQQGYGQEETFGGYAKPGPGFSPFAANRLMQDYSGGLQMVPNPAGGRDIPMAQLAATMDDDGPNRVPGFQRMGYANGSSVYDYLPALAMGESGAEKDPYLAVSPPSKKGLRAYGKYQVQETNIPVWAEEAGFGRLTPQEFLANKKAQEKIAAMKFGQYMAKSGLEGDAAAREAAKMWFGGPGYRKNMGARDVLGTSIPEYEARFARNLGRAGGSSPTAGFANNVLAMDQGDEDRTVATDAPAREAGGFQITPEMQLGIISAGLGMLANRSPFMSVGVGEGGLKGVEAYMQAQQQKRAADVAATQMENVKSEIAQRTAETGLKERQLKMLMDADEAARALIYGRPAPAKTAEAETGVAPTVAADEGARGEQGAPAQLPGGDLAAAEEPKPVVVATDRESMAADLDPLWDPRRLAQLAQVWSVANPQLAKLYQERLDRIQESGMTYNRSGQPVPLPGYLEKKASVAATEETARKAAESQFTYVDIQPEPGGPVYKVKQSELNEFMKQNPNAQPVNPGAGSAPGGEVTKMPKGAVVTKQPEFVAERQKEIAKGEMAMLEQFQVRQVMRERLDTMADILARYQPGKWAQQKAELINGLRSIGLPVSEENMRSAADFETFTKNATVNLFDQVKNLGGRILVSEIEGLKQANPSASLQPETNKRIIGQIRGLLDYEDKHYEDYSQWREKNPNAYDASKFERDWVKENKPKKFIEESTGKIAAKGEVLPPKEQLTVGYKIVRGSDTYEWDGSRFRKVAK